MIEMYAITSANTVQRVGEILGIGSAFNAAEVGLDDISFMNVLLSGASVRDKSTIRPVYLTPDDSILSVSVRIADYALRQKIHTAMYAKTPPNMALGWSDGTAAPTAAAGAFVFPSRATRGFVNIGGIISNITERNTDTGIVSTIFFDISKDQLTKVV